MTIRLGFFRKQQEINVPKVKPKVLHAEFPYIRITYRIDDFYK